MSDIKLFSIRGGLTEELLGSSLAVEKTLQVLMEANLEAVLGVRFLATEFSTGQVHGGRIDTLGLDENGSPVIIEYKRATNENVINQGLFYLDWLLDHRGEFTLLAMSKLGLSAEDIDWSGPRLVCIAGDFTRYDEYAVLQIARNIELYRYRAYGDGLLLLELVHGSVKKTLAGSGAGAATSTALSLEKTVSQILEAASPSLRSLYDALDAFLSALGDDVSVKTNKNYFAYRRIKNFACVEVHPKAEQLLVYLKVDPDEVSLQEGFTRDVRGLGHWGTGDLELRLGSADDLARAESLLARSYEVS